MYQFFKNKKLIPFLLTFLFIIFFIPLIKTPLIDLAKYPLKITKFFFNEFKALLFFQYNYLENIRLTKEIGLLKQQMVNFKELSLENERLKSILSFKQNSNFSILPARVIMRSPDNWSSFIVIDRGKKDGLKKNLAVISPSGLVGKVAEVGDFTSKVILATDPNFCVSAIIQDSRQQGLVCGTLEDYFIMRYLSDKEKYQLKTPVITAGLTEFFPKGILIGEVMEVKKDVWESGVYLKIKPAVDFNKLEEVEVILKK